MSPSTDPLVRPGYAFDAKGLSCYLRCPKSFFYHYVREQAWPTGSKADAATLAPDASGAHAARGHAARMRTLRRWLQRAHHGVDVEEVTSHATDEVLAEWWTAAQSFQARLQRECQEAGAVCKAELSLMVPLANHRLRAHYAYLVLRRDGRGTVVNWCPPPEQPVADGLYQQLRTAMQTRVQMYALATAGHVWTGGERLEPTNLEITYWFASSSGETISISYSAQQYRRDEQELSELVREIASLSVEGFDANEGHCSTCEHVALCEDASSAADRASRGQEDAEEPTTWLGCEPDYRPDAMLRETPGLEYL